MLLKGKNAVITGCARGIGASMLEVFASNGANIWACARKSTEEFETKLRGLEAAHGVQITPVYFDMANHDEIKAGMKTVLFAKKSVDVLVNNAGIIYNALFQMTSIDKMKEMFEINYFSQILITQYVLRAMIKQKSGSIINMASIVGIDGVSGRTAYGASKAAFINSTKVLSAEVADYNIRVNAVAPGITETDMMATMTSQVVEDSLGQSNLKRPAQPSEVANTVLFLASDLSSYLTGQVIRVDGGI